jgi:integrase
MTRRTPPARASVNDGADLTFDVRMWSIRAYEGVQRRTYTVRWGVAGREHRETFASRALADNYRAKLLTFIQRGAPFDKATGLPEPMARELRSRTWYEHACAYVDMKWAKAAPKTRRSTAEALTTVTPAMFTSARGRPAAELIREALLSWVFVTPARSAGPPPDHLVEVVQWVERSTVNMAELEDRTKGSALVRQALDLAALRLDGKPAAPNTVARKRAVLYNALAYAVEVGPLAANPIDFVQWASPKAVETVDRRAVVNPQQARQLLGAVRTQGRLGRRLYAFFALMYYAALRPSEVLGLRRSNLVSLPKTGWGELLLGRTTPSAGTAWTDSGVHREERGLKHRPEGDTRLVPAHPELVVILIEHIQEFGTSEDDRIFVGPRGGAVAESAYLAVWHNARRAVLTPTQARSPLARRPYDLRHAAVSTWLNAGVPATQVAEWAGHGVAVLLRTYAKCIVGQDEAARRRIGEALLD